jgi:hypothetical protein
MTHDTTLFENLERQIRENDLRFRLEFGNELVKLRDGKKLPAGLLKAIVEKVGVSRAEVNNRTRFAERCAADGAFSNVLDNPVPWRDVVKMLTRKQGTALEETKAQPAARDAHLRRLLGEAMDVDPKQVQDHAAIANLLHDLLKHYEHATAAHVTEQEAA